MYLEIWAGIKKTQLICSMRPQCSFSTSKSTKWVFQHVWIELSPNTCTVVRYINLYSQAIQTTLDRDGVFYISQLGMCWEVLWVKSWGLSPLPSVDVEVCTVFIIDKILFYIYNSNFYI